MVRPDGNPSSTTRLDLAFTGIATFLRGPVCADPASLDADFAFIGFPCDEGSGWLPGARLGPRRVRELSLRFRSCNTGGREGFWDINSGERFLEDEMAENRIVDCGDVDVIYTNIDATWQNATDLVSTVLDRGATPIVVGGDHAATYPVLRAYGQDVQFLHFDAHLDYQPFVHGVTQSHGNPVRLAHGLPTVRHIVQVGMRSFRTPEHHYRDTIADGNRVLTTRDYLRDGPERVLAELDPNLPVYISVDLDVLDAAIVPGVATPEPGGLDYEHLRDVLAAVSRNLDVCGLDIVELNPMVDTPNQITSFLCAQLLVETMGSISSRGRRSFAPLNPPNPLKG
ncbi:arginase family protein [Micromonospora sp. NBC_01655]|uniref:arginase family protein n=1 Tax=Micromonospora sp. NBC_01655 TaxID=2975983 RepID=UPI00224DAF4B|nr:arginase family protein [Micromonospora sp. NBC_01655]MCX4469592.1 arginase family protein [Micromonospora sp. NBC_01655]